MDARPLYSTGLDSYMQARGLIGGHRVVMSYYITRGTVASSRLIMLGVAPNTPYLAILPCCVCSPVQCRSVRSRPLPTIPESG
jgi:hypothetical protein